MLPFGFTQPKEQPRLLQQLSLFYLLPFPRKKLGDLRPWTHHVFLCYLHWKISPPLWPSFSTLRKFVLWLPLFYPLCIYHLHIQPSVRGYTICCVSVNCNFSYHIFCYKIERSSSCLKPSLISKSYAISVWTQIFATALSIVAFTSLISLLGIWKYCSASYIFSLLKLSQPCLQSVSTR